MSRHRSYALDLSEAPYQLVARFWSHVDVGTDTQCWEWRAHRTPRGYGRFQVSWLTPQSLKAARVAYALAIGPIPDDLTIDHRCENPGCVNPKHLQLVTVAENQRLRGLRATHCRRGHPWTPENEMWDHRRGTRRCRQCKSDHYQPRGVQ